jgi:hypothetical protein
MYLKYINSYIHNANQGKQHIKIKFETNTKPEKLNLKMVKKNEINISI